MKTGVLLDKLNVIYNNFDSALDDESVRNIGKRINNINDDLGAVIQSIEEEGIDSDSDKASEA